MTINTRNFQNYETQIVTATTGGVVASFATQKGQKARDIRYVNEGTVAAWVLPSATSAVAPNSSTASGTQAYYLLPGEDIVLRKPPGGSSPVDSVPLLPFVGATTDTGTAVIVMHAGKGS